MRGVMLLQEVRREREQILRLPQRQLAAHSVPALDRVADIHHHVDRGGADVLGSFVELELHQQAGRYDRTPVRESQQKTTTAHRPSVSDTAHASPRAHLAAHAHLTNGCHRLVELSDVYFIQPHPESLTNATEEPPQAGECE